MSVNIPHLSLICLCTWRSFQLYRILNAGLNERKDYIYTAGGQKLRKIAPDGSTTNYVGSIVYEGGAIKYILNGEGTYQYGETASQNEYQYHLKDHLGNTRMVVNQNGKEIQQSAYYPFGLAFMQTINSDNKYLYNGKELQDDKLNGVKLDWYDYGARMYDAMLGRFHRVDPLAERGPGWSVYAYTFNNPIRFLDPDGRWPWEAGFWKSYSQKAEQLKNETIFAIHYRIDKPGLLINDVTNFMDGLSTLAADVTGISTLVTGENKTAEAIGNAINTVSELPSMSSEERGAIAAVCTVVVFDIATTRGGGAAKGSRVFEVGSYNSLRGVEAGLDAHHVGQKALMSKFVPGYNASTAPSILVPKLGHTQGVGVLSRGSSSLSNARQVLARDIFELRRVYPNVPNSSLQQLIQMNKSMYPGAFVK